MENNINHPYYGNMGGFNLANSLLGSITQLGNSYINSPPGSIHEIQSQNQASRNAFIAQCLGMMNTRSGEYNPSRFEKAKEYAASVRARKPEMQVKRINDFPNLDLI